MENASTLKSSHVRNYSLEIPTTSSAYDNPAFVEDNSPTSTEKYQLPVLSSAKKADEYDPHNFAKEHLTTSFCGAVFHIFIICAGPAVLTLPGNFLNVGIVIGCASTFTMVLFYAYNISMVVDAEYQLCREKRTPNLTYSETVYYTFALGPSRTKGLAPYCRNLSYAVFSLLWVGGNAFNLVLIGQNFQTAYKVIYEEERDVGLRTGMYILIVPLLLLCWIRHLKYLIPVSFLGNFMNILVILSVVYRIVRNPNFDSTQPQSTSLRNLPLFLGTLLYSLNGTGIMVPLKNDMKYPQKFNSMFGVLTVSFAPMTFMYTFFELLCVLKYGTDLRSSVVMNLPEDELLTKIVLVLFILSVCFQFPLITYIVFDIFWNNILKEKREKMVYKLFWEYVTRTGIVVVMFACAVLVPNINLFLSFSGTVGTPIDSMILPAVMNSYMWLKKCKNNKTKLSLLLCKNVLICLFAEVLIVFGIKDCIHQFADTITN